MAMRANRFCFSRPGRAVLRVRRLRNDGAVSEYIAEGLYQFYTVDSVITILGKHLGPSC